MSESEIKIFYDGECLFCSSFVKYSRLKDTVGKPDLIDLRQNNHAKEMLKDQNFDLDQGMVVLYQDHYYHGADAVHILSFLSSKNSIFNIINKLLFSVPMLAKLFYPLLRAGRNFILMLLGRQPIDNKILKKRSSIIRCLLLPLVYSASCISLFIHLISISLHSLIRSYYFQA